MSGVAAYFTVLAVIALSVVVGIAVGGFSGVAAGLAVTPTIISLGCATQLRDEPAYGPLVCVTGTVALILGGMAYLLS